MREERGNTPTKRQTVRQENEWDQGEKKDKAKENK